METGNVYILLSGLIGTILSLIVTMSINIFFQRRYIEKSFAETRMKLNRLMLKEPFLRTDTYFEELRTGDEKEDRLRYIKYDLFCVMLYNYLKSICEYYNYDEDKFVDQYNFRQNIDGSKEWWKKKRQKNELPYRNDKDKGKFVSFVDKFIER